MHAPIILSDSVSLAAGATGVLDLTKLQAPQSQAMFVREIVFTASLPASAGDLGGIVWAKIEAGRFAITNDFVPIWNFAPPYDRYYNDLNALGQVGARGDGITTTYTTYRWILPAPMYVAPGGGIKCTFFRTNRFDASFTAAVTGASITARCAVIGNLTDGKTPAEIDVPYVTAFVPAVSGDTGVRKSLERDLSNECGKVITTQRFVGAILGLAGAATSTPKRYYSLSQANAVKVGIIDPYNRSITSNPTQPAVDWEAIFHPQDPTWTLRQRVDPGRNYQVTLSKTPALQNPGIPMISLVGSRKEVAP
jgi:hypothetical protein